MNNREAMQEAFETFMANDDKFPDGCNMTDRVFNAGYDAALAAQQQDHIPDVGNMAQAQQTESKPVVWGYAWQCKSVGDWRIEKLGEGCIPPKDTLALYVIPPAPVSDNEQPNERSEKPEGEKKP